jgi:serine/threonine protein kinase
VTSTFGMPISQIVAQTPRYESLFELEQRGCARSYLAIDRGVPPGARLVVVHVVPPSLSRDSDFVALFAARASALLSVTHPNLMRTLDFVAKGQRCQWVSEFIQGHTLSSLLAKRKGAEQALTLRQHLTILCDVLRGLEHAHRAVDAAGLPKPIVHRHLSPSSVLVSYDGTVKLTDATLCVAPEVFVGRFEGEAERLAYQAPECCLGSVDDPRSDVFAVGALLWEAVCQRRRPVGSSIEEALEMCRMAAEPDFDGAGPGVSPTLAAITRRALARDPGERYQSARELRLGLEAQMPPVPMGRDRASLFAFMCNHFFEEHGALERLLESRAPGVLDITDARQAVVAANADASSESSGPDSHAESGAPAHSSAPALADVGESVGSSRLGRRVRQAIAALSIAGTMVLTFPLVRPDIRSQRATESVLHQLRSQPDPTASAPAAPAPAPSVAAPAAPAPAPSVAAPAPTPPVAAPPVAVPPAVPTAPAPPAEAPARASDPSARAKSGAAASAPVPPGAAASAPRGPGEAASAPLAPASAAMPPTLEDGPDGPP